MAARDAADAAYSLRHEWQRGEEMDQKRLKVSMFHVFLLAGASDFMDTDKQIST